MELYFSYKIAVNVSQFMHLESLKSHKIMKQHPLLQQLLTHSLVHIRVL